MGGFFIAVGVVYVMAILVQVACYRSNLKKALKTRAGAVAAEGC